MDDTPDELLEKCAYNITLTEQSLSIQSLEVHITTSYTELGRPQRHQTIEGNEHAITRNRSIKTNLAYKSKNEIHSGPCHPDHLLSDHARSFSAQ